MARAWISIKYEFIHRRSERKPDILIAQNWREGGVFAATPVAKLYRARLPAHLVRDSSITRLGSISVGLPLQLAITIVWGCIRKRRNTFGRDLDRRFDTGRILPAALFYRSCLPTLPARSR